MFRIFKRIKDENPWLINRRKKKEYGVVGFNSKESFILETKPCNERIDFHLLQAKYALNKIETWDEYQKYKADWHIQKARHLINSIYPNPSELKTLEEWQEQVK